MPQFNFTHFAPQIFWLAIIFAVLFFGVIRTTLPRIATVVDARTAMIDQDLSAAAAARDAAIAANTGFEHVLTAARTSAGVTLGSAKAEATQASDAQLKTLDATLGEQAAVAAARIDGMRTAAMGEVQALAAQTANDIVRKLTGAGVSDDAAAQAVLATRLAKG